MATSVQHYVLVAIVFIAIISPCLSIQPSTADEIIEKDRNARQSATRAGRHVAGTPKRGFFGTIFHVILEQINDTKSAYNQISDLVNSQFADDNVSTIVIQLRILQQISECTRMKYLEGRKREARDNSHFAV
ncbi:hypothetical protein HF086_014805 [Spodoptera exigua]|uniref:Uncharacterized protein n=1 Tax=Spodoptera exigua TaxID=7107 RepID=A0A922SGT4_SPOEX|nr:hypothetical protein HF086_014805 [Spodoptera exigua]